MPLPLRQWRLGQLFLLLLVPTLLPAQAPADQRPATAGTVVDAQTRKPLPDAVVAVAGSALTVTTDRSGRFRFEGLSGTEVELTARRIGYRPATRRARVGDEGIELAITPTAINLDELIVTGTPEATERRALSNSIAVVDVGAAVDKAPTRSITDLLSGRAPGVLVQNVGGVVGGGPRIKVRGIASLSLTDQPLLYVDGVRVDNATATGPLGGSVSIVSRINDFNPEDIESMEIVKGPSAATLYGTEAANGVIQIITKRGSRGATPTWDFVTTQGANWFSNPAERIGLAWGLDQGGSPFSVDFTQREIDAGRSPFRTGHAQSYGANVSGGSGLLQYFLSGNHERQQGVDPTNDLHRTSGRLNFTITPSTKFKITANAGYTSGLTNFPTDAGFGGPIWSLQHGRPAEANSPSGGWVFGAPRDWQEAFFFSQGLDRFTGGLQLEHRPASWFTQRVNLGLDRVHEANINLIPRMSDRLRGVFGGGLGAGSKSIQDRATRTSTVDYAGTATATIGAFESQTSVGFQFYRRIEERKTARGDGFPTPGLTALSSTARTSVSEDGLINNTTVGMYVQEQLSWRRRLYLTLGLRGDDNSAFGSEFEAAYYPKAGVAWVLSDEPFWPGSSSDMFRLRASYGQSGQQPTAFAALRRYLPATGGDGNPVVTPSAVGNPDLKPERGVEIEAGFDAGLLDDRLGLEFTWYDKTTRDAIVTQELPPSAGFPGTRLANLGRIRNRGFEFQARAQVITGPNLALELLGTIARNDDKVLEVGGTNDFIAFGRQRHQEGYPVAAFFGRKILSADIGADGTATNLVCDDGQGGAVGCSSAPTVFLQRTLPTTTGSFQPTLTLFSRLRVSAMVEFSRGRWMLDGDLLGRCGESGNCRQFYFPNEYPSSVIAGVQSFDPLNYALSDAGFAKLREVSVNYTLPDRIARLVGATRGSVSLSGYNLATWTSFSGIDPETTISIGNVFGALNYSGTPPLTKIVGAVRLSF